jgi:hypothetical protein
MNKDIEHADPAEGARDVIDRQLERQDRGEAESRVPVTRRGKQDAFDNERGEPE